MTPDLSHAMHVVVDMQGLFAEHPDWAVKDIAGIRREVQWLAERPRTRAWVRRALDVVVRRIA